MNDLLVPFDASECSERALRYAIRLARDIGSVSIHVVNAHEEPDIYGEIAVYVTPEKMAELQRSGSETLLAGAEKILKESKVPYTTEILIGDIAEMIAKRADELGCKGIVMGARGRTALGNLLMGSVATKVIHHANVPVTIVK
jgi:nucleotide-binding universal stress UspA family protein